MMVSNFQVYFQKFYFILKLYAAICAGEWGAHEDQKEVDVGSPGDTVTGGVVSQGVRVLGTESAFRGRETLLGAVSSV